MGLLLLYFPNDSYCVYVSSFSRIAMNPKYELVSQRRTTRRSLWASVINTGKCYLIRSYLLGSLLSPVVSIEPLLPSLKSDFNAPQGTGR